VECGADEIELTAAAEVTGSARSPHFEGHQLPIVVDAYHGDGASVRAEGRLYISRKNVLEDVIDRLPGHLGCQSMFASAPSRTPAGLPSGCMSSNRSMFSPNINLRS
jgi:hypothetical protein